MPKDTGECSIYFRVTDRKAFIRAARKQAIADKAARNMKEAAELVDDVSSAARWLFDPGVSPDGCEILDSTCEIGR